MPNQIAELMTFCQALQQQGQAPSVALLRSKYPGRVGVADAIEAIKRFQAGEVVKAPVSSAAPKPESDLQQMQQKIDQLETLTRQLVARIEALEKRD